MPVLSRRAFLATATAGAMGALGARAARAEETVTVGLVVPSAGAVADALEQGARLGLDDANALATLFGKRLQLILERAPDAGAGAAAGRRLATAGAIAVVGGAGAGTADGLRDAAASGSTLFLNVAAIDETLRHERCDRHVFHLAPSVSMLADALGEWLAGRRLLRWTISPDGGGRSREIEAAAQRAATRHGASVVGEAPSDVMWLAAEGRALREMLTRARAAGRTVVGVGGDLPMRLRPDEAAGFWAVAWHYELERFSGRELNGRYRRRFGAPLDEVSWAAWAAMKLVGEGVVRGGAAGPAALLAFFESAPPFDGHKGAPLTFRKWDHQLRQPLYVLGARRPEEITGRRGPFAVVGETSAPDLDTYGTGAADSRCRQGAR